MTLQLLLEEPALSQPDYIPVGPSVRLISLPALARSLGLNINQTVLALKDLGVPSWSWPEGHQYDYYSLPALEIALYRHMRGGGDLPSDKELIEEMEAVGRSWSDMDKRRMRAAVTEFARLLKEGEPVLPKEPG